jgi:hypothetical protein
MVPYLIGILFAIPAWRYAQHVTRWHALPIMAGVSLGYAITLAIAIDRLVFDFEERRWFRSVIRRELSRVFGAIGIGAANGHAA